jgi:hypothetical protein
MTADELISSINGQLGALDAAIALCVPGGACRAAFETFREQVSVSEDGTVSQATPKLSYRRYQKDLRLCLRAHGVDASGGMLAPEHFFRHVARAEKA